MRGTVDGNEAAEYQRALARNIEQAHRRAHVAALEEPPCDDPVIAYATGEQRKSNTARTFWTRNALLLLLLSLPTWLTIFSYTAIAGWLPKAATDWIGFGGGILLMLATVYLALPGTLLCVCLFHVLFIADRKRRRTIFTLCYLIPLATQIAMIVAAIVEAAHAKRIPL